MEADPVHGRVPWWLGDQNITFCALTGGRAVRGGAVCMDRQLHHRSRSQLLGQLHVTAPVSQVRTLRLGGEAAGSGTLSW